MPRIDRWSTEGVVMVAEDRIAALEERVARLEEGGPAPRGARWDLGAQERYKPRADAAWRDGPELPAGGDARASAAPPGWVAPPGALGAPPHVPRFPVRATKPAVPPVFAAKAPRPARDLEDFVG